MSVLRTIGSFLTGTASQSVLAMILAFMLGILSPTLASSASILGDVFIEILKLLAPVLMFVSLSTSTAQINRNNISKIGLLLVFYTLSIFCAIFVSCLIGIVHPIEIDIAKSAAPNSVEALSTENLFSILLANPPFYLFVLIAGFLFGLLMRIFPNGKLSCVQQVHDAVLSFSFLILKLTPIGIFGLVTGTVAENDLTSLLVYVKLQINLALAVIVIFTFVLPSFCKLLNGSYPYELLLLVLKESAFYAFLTRSSIANIPINLRLAQKLQIDPQLAATAVSLGAVIHMPGAAITITSLSLCTLQSLGFEINWLSLALLISASFLCTIAAGGIPAGGLMMVPFVLSVFGVDADTAMIIVGVGFIMGLLQDAIGTALNSSSDIYLTMLVFGKKRPPTS